ncbi:MAG: sodium:solute symporter family protein [Bacteroidota bacterium]
MRIHWIDIAIILAYLLAVIGIGLYLREKTSRSKGDYMLGGNTLPWWMLGISNASGMFDISGTIWLVTITFVYGLKGIWLPWLWPVFNQVFLMIYLSIWLRKSRVTTGAEWMMTRFGKGRGSELAHSIVVVFAIFSCLGFMAYGFIGLGKFIEIFIPWEQVEPYVPFSVSPAYVPHFYGIVFSLIATIYAILGGMSSIVWADVLQYVIMTIASIGIAIIAMVALGGNALDVPPGWYNPFFGWDLHLDWSQSISEVNQKIEDDAFSPFGLFFSIMLFKGVLASIAGPAPNYDMQKILSSKSPREAALMSGFVNLVLMPARYFMVIGFVVLAILYYNQLDLSAAQGLDFEKILPSAIQEFAPIGLYGLLLTGLMAAFMGTFAGTLNAAQAYIVNDIYLKNIHPQADPGRIRWMNYLVGILVVLVSIVLGLFAKDVNSILQWIVSALYGGYVAANVLKWHWWRFNGEGFFWGMLSGIVPALIFPYILPDVQPLYYFPLILIISLIGSIVGTLLNPPTDLGTLKRFYKKVKPWGYWGAIRQRVQIEDPAFRANPDFYRDSINVVVGIIAQLSLVALPIFIVLYQWSAAGGTGVILLITLLILWKNWYLNLDKSTN